MAGSGAIADIRERLDAYLESEGQTLGHRRATLEMWANPWGVEHASYDPEPALRAFNGPVLALYGSNDLQVSVVENAPVMRRLLSHSQSEVVVLDGLNHLFQPSESGRVSEYMWIDTTIDSAAMALITSWMNNL